MAANLNKELDSKEWAQKLRQLRKEKDWSQKELADALGVHRQTVSDMERGVNQFTLERLNRVLEALGYRAVVELQEFERETVADWGPLKAKDPEMRKRVRQARQFAEAVAARLYSAFDVNTVCCFGSLVEDGGVDFDEDSDIDILVEGLEGSRLFSAISDLEMEVVETSPEYQQFSFDIVRVEDVELEPSRELIAAGRAVRLPRN